MIQADQDAMYPWHDPKFVAATRVEYMKMVHAMCWLDMEMWRDYKAGMPSVLRTRS